MTIPNGTQLRTGRTTWTRDADGWHTGEGEDQRWASHVEEEVLDAMAGVVAERDAIINEVGPKFNTAVFFRRGQACSADEADALRNEIGRMYKVASDLRVASLEVKHGG